MSLLREICAELHFIAPGLSAETGSSLVQLLTASEA